MRSLGSMNLNFGLVNVPVKMFAATESHDPEFHQYHQHEDGSAARVNFVVRCSECAEELRRTDCVRGVERDDQVVLISSEELAETDSEASKDLEIMQFCRADEIDPLMLAGAYYLAPDTKTSKRAPNAYAVLRDVLGGATGLVGVVRYTLRGKTHMAVLRVVAQTLVVHNLIWSDELRSPEFVLTAEVQVDPRAVTMAHQLVESLTDTFDPAKFVDERAVRIAELIDAKTSGDTMTAREEQQAQAEVGDLLARLEASVKPAAKTRQRRTRKTA